MSMHDSERSNQENLPTLSFCINPSGGLPPMYYYASDCREDRERGIFITELDGYCESVMMRLSMTAANMRQFLNGLEYDAENCRLPVLDALIACLPGANYHIWAPQGCGTYLCEPETNIKISFIGVDDETIKAIAAAIGGAHTDHVDLQQAIGLRNLKAGGNQKGYLIPINAPRGEAKDGFFLELILPNLLAEAVNAKTLASVGRTYVSFDWDLTPDLAAAELWPCDLNDEGWWGAMEQILNALGYQPDTPGHIGGITCEAVRFVVTAEEYESVLEAAYERSPALREPLQELRAACCRAME